MRGAFIGPGMIRGIGRVAVFSADRSGYLIAMKGDTQYFVARERVTFIKRKGK